MTNPPKQRNSRVILRWTIVVPILAVLGILATHSAQAQTLTTLYNFTGSSGGTYPTGSLVPDQPDNLDGTKYGVSASGRLPAHSLRTIDVPGATGTEAYDINTAKTIVGAYYDSVQNPHGFVLINGTFKLFDVPNSLITLATAINDKNQIVGYYGNAISDYGYVYHGGVFTTLDFPDSAYTLAFGINNAGQIVGGYADANLAQHAFLLQNGKYTTYDVPRARATGFRGINNNGDIVGGFTDYMGVEHGLLLVGKVLTQLDYPGSSDTFALGINDSGDIVGRDFSAGAGFILKDKVFHHIVIPNSYTSRSVGLNNADVIVGYYEGSGGMIHGYVVMP